jgi:hypothetical protein
LKPPRGCIEANFTRSRRKRKSQSAILDLEENKGLSARDVAVNSLDQFKPRIAESHNANGIYLAHCLEVRIKVMVLIERKGMKSKTKDDS